MTKNEKKINSNLKFKLFDIVARNSTILALLLLIVNSRTAKTWCAVAISRGNIQTFLKLRHHLFLMSKSNFLEFYLSSLRLLGFIDLASELNDNLRTDKPINQLKNDSGSRLFSSENFAPIGHTALLFYYLRAESAGIIKKKKNIVVGHQSGFDCAALLDVVRQNSKNKLNFFHKNNESTKKITQENLETIFLKSGQLVNAVQLQYLTQKSLEKHSNQFCKLPDSLIERGREYLQSKGISKEDWFVVLHVRNSKSFYRDARNADLNSYELCVESIQNKGGFVIRIGEPTAYTQIDKHPNYIDYGGEKQNNPDIQDLDSFFLGSCKFMIGTGSGPAAVPLIFGRPVLFTNWAPIGMMNGAQNCLWLPKRMVCTKSNMEIPLLQRLKAFGSLESNFGAQLNNVRYLDNDPLDLANSVDEMLEHLAHGNKHYKFSELENDFQSELHDRLVYPVKLSTSFLKYQSVQNSRNLGIM